MNYNRAMLATMTFEPFSSSSDDTSDASSEDESYKPTTATGKPEGIADSADNKAKSESVESDLIIACLKRALAKVIRNISQPEKRRPLNARADFTIQTKMEFKTQRSTGISCCGPKSTSVKTRFDYANNSDESSDDVGASTNADEVYFPSVTDGDDNGEDALETDFTFIDYSPMCYRHMREFFNVDAKAYSDVLLGSVWHSIPTPGKSGAHLFFCGRDWVIKTMNDSESDFLRSILHRYYYHVRDNPYTLLPRFVGHHQLIIGSRRFNLIVMKNVFATPNTIHEKFDLKGSTIGRFASQAEKLRATCTQKDLDIHQPVHIGDVRRRVLIQQIANDAEFLKRSDIMDYSLLVGIHVLRDDGGGIAGGSSTVSKRDGGAAALAATVASPTLPPLASTVFAHDLLLNKATELHNIPPGTQEVTGACFTADQGGMMSSEVPGARNELYYLGIIDILQEYNARKRLEHFFVGMAHDYQRISCVNPSQYAARFVDFVSSIIA